MGELIVAGCTASTEIEINSVISNYYEKEISQLFLENGSY